VKHPTILQIRGNLSENDVDLILRIVKNHGKDFEIEKERNGLNVFFSDVNEARSVISKLKKLFKAEVKMSTKYAGLRKGRVRVLFVYSFRI